MNLTDVDDKTIRDSRRAEMALRDFTAIHKKAFFEDLRTLNIESAEVYPAATDHIPDMVAMIRQLQERGYTYDVEGSIYFRLDRFPGYGKLAHLDAETLQNGASGRVDRDEYAKDDVRDFALWKAWTPEDGDVFWETELGKGRPGWHIECSAMSMKYLGPHFDIHTGGEDNIFSPPRKRDRPSRGRHWRNLCELLAALPSFAGRQYEDVQVPGQFFHPARPSSTRASSRRAFATPC